MLGDFARRNRFWLILGFILLIALGFRLSTVGHGLPAIQVGDENSDLSTALRLFQGEFPDRTVRYHRSLIAYVNAASIGAFFGYRLLSGQIASLDAFRQLYFSNRAVFTLATRLMFTLLTTLTIALVALAGRCLSVRVGLLAAALLTVNGFFTLNSAYALPDTLILFTTALCLWLSLRLYDKRRPRDYFLAGLALALVMLSKLSAAPIGIGILIAHAAITWQDQTHSSWLRRVFTRRLLWLLAGLVLGNLLFNPIAFFYPADLIFEIQRLGGYAYESTAPTLADRFLLIASHLADAVRLAGRWLLPGWFLGLLALVRDRRNPRYWIILSVFVVLLLTIASVVTVYYKVFYWTPAVIPLVLLSAIGLDLLCRCLAARRLSILAYGLMALVIALEGSFTVGLSAKMVLPDTRAQALDFIRSNYPPDTRIISGEPNVYSVPLLRDAASIQRARTLGAANLAAWDWWLGLAAAERPGPAYNLYSYEMQARVNSFDDLQSLIVSQKIDLVIEADYCWGTQNRPDSDAPEEFPALNSQLRSHLELIAVFSPYAAGCEAAVEQRTGLALDNLTVLLNQQSVGPLIRVYRPRPG